MIYGHDNVPPNTQVYEAEKMQFFVNCVFVDTTNVTYALLDIPYRMCSCGQHTAYTKYQAKKIDVNLRIRLITINPIEDTDGEETENTTEAGNKKPVAA